MNDAQANDARAIDARANRCDEQSRLISIDWALDNGSLLKLRAHLGSDWIMPPFDPSGGFYSSCSDAASDSPPAGLPAWSVRWSLGK